MTGDVHFDLKEHRATGLLVVRAREYPGFLLHADTIEEIDEKLIPAFESYLRAIGTPTGGLVLSKSDGDYWPPELVARAEINRAA